MCPCLFPLQPKVRRAGTVGRACPWSQVHCITPTNSLATYQTTKDIFFIPVYGTLYVTSITYVIRKCLSTAQTTFNFHIDIPNTGTMKSMYQAPFTPNEDITPKACEVQHCLCYDQVSFHMQATVHTATFNYLHNNLARILILTA